jgi:methylamine dehydrogenase accessory protein MauD
MDGVWLVAFAVLWVLVVIEAFFIFAILRQIGLLNARIPVRRRGLPQGARAPAFDLPDLSGESVSWDSFTNQEVLLAFVTPTCPGCRQLVPALNALQAKRGDAGVAVQVVCSGQPDECQGFALQEGLMAPMVTDPAKTTLEPYQVPGVPFVVSIDRKGVVRNSGFAGDLAGLERLCGLDGFVAQAGAS